MKIIGSIVLLIISKLITRIIGKYWLIFHDNCVLLVTHILMDGMTQA